MSAFEPASIAALPREMLAQICQQASLEELHEFCAHPPLRERLKSLISFVSDSQRASSSPSHPFEPFHGFPLAPFTQQCHAPVLLIDIHDLEHFPLAEYKRHFLGSTQTKYVCLSDKAKKLWNGVLDLHGRKMPLKKFVNFFDDDNTVLAVPRSMTKLHLRNTIITGVKFWAEHTLSEVSLRNVNVACKHNPFALLKIEQMIMDVVPHRTLDRVTFHNVKHLLIWTCGKDVINESSTTWVDYDSFFASRWEGLRSASLESIEIHGFNSLQDWDVPNLRQLSIDMTPLTDEGHCFPSLKHMDLSGLEEFNIMTSLSPHKVHDVKLPKDCRSNVLIVQRSKEKYAFHTDDLYLIVPNLSIEVSDEHFQRMDQKFVDRIVNIVATTKTREAQKALFHNQGYQRLKSLTWNVVGGPEIASISHMKIPVSSLRHLKVDVIPSCRIHLDFKYICNNFGKVTELDLNGCYYNKKLIEQRDIMKSGELQLPRLEKIHLKRYPEEVLDVFFRMDAPKLKEIYIETDKQPLSAKCNVNFSLYSSSVVERIEIKMTSDLNRFTSSRRHIHINGHPFLKELKVDSFNSVGISNCKNLQSIKINREDAPLSKIVADSLPHLRVLEYPLSDIARGGTYNSLYDMLNVDKAAVSKIESFPDRTKDNLRRVLSVCKSSDVANNNNYGYQSPVPEVTAPQRQPLILEIKSSQSPAPFAGPATSVPVAYHTATQSPIVQSSPLDSQIPEPLPVSVPVPLPETQQPSAPTTQPLLSSEWVDSLVSGAAFNLQGMLNGAGMNNSDSSFVAPTPAPNPVVHRAPVPAPAQSSLLTPSSSSPPQITIKRDIDNDYVPSWGTQQRARYQSTQAQSSSQWNNSPRQSDQREYDTVHSQHDIYRPAPSLTHTHPPQQESHPQPEPQQRHPERHTELHSQPQQRLPEGPSGSADPRSGYTSRIVEQPQPQRQGQLQIDNAPYQETTHQEQFNSTNNRVRYPTGPKLEQDEDELMPDKVIPRRDSPVDGEFEDVPEEEEEEEEDLISRLRPTAGSPMPQSTSPELTLPRGPSSNPLYRNTTSRVSKAPHQKQPARSTNGLASRIGNRWDERARDRDNHDTYYPRR